MSHGREANAAQDTFLKETFMNCLHSFYCNAAIASHLCNRDLIYEKVFLQPRRTDHLQNQRNHVTETLGHSFIFDVNEYKNANGKASHLKIGKFFSF